jgi:hypothetical protein
MLTNEGRKWIMAASSDMKRREGEYSKKNKKKKSKRRSKRRSKKMSKKGGKLPKH